MQRLVPQKTLLGVQLHFHGLYLAAQPAHSLQVGGKLADHLG